MHNLHIPFLCILHKLFSFSRRFPFLRKNWHGVCFISGQNTIDAEVQEEGASSGQALRIKS